MSRFYANVSYFAEYHRQGYQSMHLCWRSNTIHQSWSKFQFQNIERKIVSGTFFEFCLVKFWVLYFFFQSMPLCFNGCVFFFLITGFNERKETSNWHERPSHSTHTKLQVRFLSWVVDQVCGCCVFFFAINALV